MKSLLILCVVALLAAAAWAQDLPAGEPAAEGTELSTDLDVVDSLDVTPDAIDEPYAGGTRRISLESTVFRREAPVEYHANGRRDPFRAMLTDSRGNGEIHTDLLVLDGATLTGVVWSGQDYLAMVKDKDGTSFFLHEGDPIYGGRTVEITQTQAVFVVSSFGDSDRITLKVRK